QPAKWPGDDFCVHAYPTRNPTPADRDGPATMACFADCCMLETGELTMSINKNHHDASRTANQPKKVLIIARISTENQDLKSLDDQVAFCRDWVEKNLEGPFEYIVESSRGSG